MVIVLTGVFTAARDSVGLREANRRPPAGLKAKDLVGQPWRLAFALQDWGWYLRQDIIWHKPNPMPESVKDRCTKSHEYIFLLSKSPRYYFDQDAIREPAKWIPPESGGSGVGFGHGYDDEAKPRYKTPDGWDTSKGHGGHGSYHQKGREKGKVSGGISAKGYEDSKWERRNKRSVWTVPSESYSGAHFATFPTALIEPCILAGSKPGDTVLDPFFGSGTTGQVCNHLGREYIGIELNPEYRELQEQRAAQQGLQF